MLALNSSRSIIIGEFSFCLMSSMFLSNPWVKNVLLFSGNQNTFRITAKKFLGSETNLIEQIIYNNTNTATTTTVTTTTTTGTTTKTDQQLHAGFPTTTIVK